MFYSLKAYSNGVGGGQVMNLSHDVKRALAESRGVKGLVNVVSTGATTAVALMENDPEIQKHFAEQIMSQFKVEAPAAKSRRSGTGPDVYHHYAALIGLSLTVPFENGRLCLSPYHDVVSFDFEPKKGRREFIITVLGE